MKFSSLLLLLTLAFVQPFVFGQTIRIVDNNAIRPTGANIFTTLTAAVTAAAPGDIIYLQPSPTSYGDVTIGKRLTIQGVGFGITELGDKSSTLGTITLLSSSDGATSTANSVFKGFNFNNIVFAQGGTGSLTYDNILIENVSGSGVLTSGSPNAVNNLTIKNCHLYGFGGNNNILLSMTNSNLQVYNCVFDSDNGVRIVISNSSNALITNNLFYTFVNGISYVITFSTNSTGIRIENNMFSGTTPVFGTLFGALVVNNIFYGTNPTPWDGSYVFKENVFSNNLSVPYANMPPPGNGGAVNSGQNNLVNLSPSFVNAPISATAWSASYDYTLGSGSPCINASSTGGNIGPSGGTYPFTQNLIQKASTLPVITLFSNPGVVNQNQPLKTNIKAKSN